MSSTPALVPITPTGKMNNAFRQAILNGSMGLVGFKHRLVATKTFTEVFDAAEGWAVITRILQFPDHEFNSDFDPHGDRDMITTIYGTTKTGERVLVYAKIDTYDNSLQFLSPDPSDDAVTTRVLTIMLAEEY